MLNELKFNNWCWRLQKKKMNDRVKGEMWGAFWMGLNGAFALRCPTSFD
jgi:hypothetical protein